MMGRSVRRDEPWGVDELARLRETRILQATVKASPEDFVVDEVGRDGRTASLSWIGADQLFTDAELAADSDDDEGAAENAQKKPLLRDVLPETVVGALEHLNEVGRRQCSDDGTMVIVEFPTATSGETAKDVRKRLYSALDALLFTKFRRLGDRFVEVTPDTRLAGLVTQAEIPHVLKVCKFGGSYDMTASENKDIRRSLHVRIAEHFPHIASETVDGNRIVRLVEKKKKAKKKRKRRDLVECVLVKRNDESFGALRTQSRSLGLGDSGICIAGVKDKRSLSFQFATVDAAAGNVRRALNNVYEKCRRQRTPLALSDHEPTRNSSSRLVPIRRLAGSPDSEPPRHLGAGDLLGNQFTVILRDVKTKDVPLELPASEEVRFLNFFGAQRVGQKTDPAPSWCIGRAILKQRYHEALKLIVNAERRSSDEFEWTRESAKRLGRQLRRGSPAADAVRNFVRFGDAAKAINAVPHKVRTIWLHSYQARLFNMDASHRVVDGKTPPPEDTMIPLVGAKTLPTPFQAAILDDDGVTLDDFHREKCNGATRRLFSTATQINVVVDTDAETLQLTFRLAPGAFATMFLREFCDHLDVCFQDDSPILGSSTEE